MKKAYLIFTLLFTTCTISLFAQTADTDSLKKHTSPIIDTTAILLKPLVIYLDTIRQQTKSSSTDSNKTFLKAAVILTDSLKQQTLIATTDSTKTHLLASSLATDSLNRQFAPNPADSLQLAAIKMPVEMNVPPLISGESLKHHPVQPGNVDTVPYPALNSVSDDDLQAGIVQEIEVNLSHAEGQFAAVAIDTVRAAIPQRMPATIASLKQQIALINNDSLKAAYYQKIADHYLNYDSISIRKTKLLYQDAALEFTLKALHSYTRAVDGYGIMKSYINLSKVYFDQKKYSQAKWFILQANTRARNYFDAPYTIYTLITLANVKMAIKDYALAKRDLDEALSISVQNHFSKKEALVQQNYAVLYVYLNQPKKATAALKRHDVIEDSILRAADAKRLAEVMRLDSTVQSKKKLDTLSGKKINKTNSYKRIASL